MRSLAAAALVAATTLLGACTPQQAAVQPVIVAPVARAAVCDTRFQVVNNSSSTVQSLQFSHSSQSGWGPDQLGTAVLPPGRTVNYQAANAGNYDFRVVWTNGRAAEMRGVNICAASQIIVTNAGLRAI
jgi:hypothetical protein